MSVVQTEHVKYDLMDYITNRLSAQEHKRVEQHLQKCSKCNDQYMEFIATETVLRKSHDTALTSAYLSTILPRVRERLISHRRSMWDYSYGTAKIILPLAVSVLLMVVLMRIHIDSSSESIQTDALHQAVMDLDEDEVVQAVEKEYTTLALSPNQEIAAAGVAEHLQGDRFLKSAVSKQIENEEVADMDVDAMISDLDGEQVDQVLSGLSERNIL
jgi:hypothetical protein